MARITRKPKGAYHHGNLREAIVAAADRVVADDGNAALTIRRVAERLGVTHTAIYHHFEDRTAMLAAVVERALARLAEAMATPSAASNALDHFRALGVAYLNFALDQPHLYAAMSGPEFTSRDHFPSVVAARARVFDNIRAAIVACQNEGFVKAGSPDEHTLFCWSAVHGLASLIVEGQVDILELVADRAALGDIVIDRVFLGLASLEALRGVDG